MSFDMEDIVIANNISKKYKIGQTKKLTEFVYSIFSAKEREFWALKNINLKVKKGEKLGIIGPNGSGKSTFLRILAGVTTPTSGKIEVNGRVAALLEVGTGFHPDLTGKENIYFYGTVLGMTPRQIRKKFDEIVIFSGVKKFLETPVKRYSSGMFMRLAFSVAIHLDWDILLLDEVLSVGDAEFQEKSLSKMQELIGGEKTVIFVSHDTQAIKRLCAKVLLFKNGRIQKEGLAESIVDLYLSQQNES